MGFNFRDFVRSLPIYNSWHNQLEMMRIESMNNGALDSLDFLHKIFEENSIKYWLFAGTLLGFIREGKPIPEDPDIDLGFWQKDFRKIENLAMNSGLIKIHEFSYDGIVYEQRYELNGVGIDFFYFIKESNLEFTYQFNRNITSFYPVKELHQNNDFSTIIKKDFSGHTYNIPVKYKTILKNTYGTWEIPLSRKDGYQMFSAPIHHHMKDKTAVFKSFSKSLHQVNLAFFVVQYILKKFKK